MLRDEGIISDKSEKLCERAVDLIGYSDTISTAMVESTSPMLIVGFDLSLRSMMAESIAKKQGVVLLRCRLGEPLANLGH